MLAQLRGEVVRVHRARVRRRRAVGATATLGVLAIATGAIWLGVRPGATSPGAPAPAPAIAQNDAERSSPVVREPSPTTPARPATPTTRIATITTDPTALDRYAADARGDTLELIDDAQLLAALHDMGQSCGIVRIKGQTLLTCTNTGAF
jgi:hypothetical protein